MRKQIDGFSLVELMVALTIGLLCTLAVTDLFLDARQSARLQRLQSVLTDDGRFGLAMTQRILAQGGYRPDPSVVPPAKLANPEASQVSVVFTADGANMVGCAGEVLLANAAQSINLAYNAQTRTLACTPQGGAPVNWIAPAQGTEIVDFQLRYGVDNQPQTKADFGCGPFVGASQINRQGDCIPDSYDPPVVAEVPFIQAVQVCMVIRTVAVLPSMTKSAAINDCGGAAIAGSQNDNRLYRAFRTTVLLNNR